MNRSVYSDQWQQWVYEHLTTSTHLTEWDPSETHHWVLLIGATGRHFRNSEQPRCHSLFQISLPDMKEVMPWDGKRRGRALPGPCPCSSCARALCASTRVRSGLTWVRWGVSCSPGLCLSAAQEHGQGPVQELQQGHVFCGQVSCGCCVLMGDNSPVFAVWWFSHRHRPVFLSHLLLTVPVQG